MEKDLKDYLLDPSKDYRTTLKYWRVDKHGNLIWVKTKNGTRKGFYIIRKSELTDCDWISHMKTKLDLDEFADFLAGYFTVLERNGIQSIKVRIYGFAHSFKFADE